MRKFSDYEIGAVSIVGTLLMLIVVVFISKIVKPVDDEWEAEPEFENSMYVGHFTNNSELRRIDDHEMGNVCYKVINQPGISCVSMQRVNDETLRHQE